MDAFEVLKLSFERHLTLDIQSPFRKLPEITTASLERFSRKYIKNESPKSYLSNSEQKAMFLHTLVLQT